MTDLQQQLADAIRFALQKDGRTQRDLAKAAGISEKHLSQMLTGGAEGSFEVWQRLVYELGRNVFVRTTRARK